MYQDQENSLTMQKLPSAIKSDPNETTKEEQSSSTRAATGMTTLALSTSVADGTKKEDVICDFENQLAKQEDEPLKCFSKQPKSLLLSGETKRGEDISNDIKILSQKAV